MPSLKDLSGTLSSLRQAEEKRQFTAKELQEFKRTKTGPNGFLESQLCLPIKEITPEGVMSGVDSGFISKNFYSFDITFVKAVSAIFNYEKGVLKKADYLPSYYPLPEIFIDTKTLLSDELNYTESIIRLLKEIEMAVKSIEQFKPRYCFLDGSIIPQYTEKPRSDSPLEKNYNSLINSFHNLYKKAELNNCTLIACVEDSRGTRFIDLLKESFSSKIPSLNSLPNSFDVVLLDSILNEKERTSCFNYTDNISNHAILKDFKPEYASQIKAFYLKPVKYDKPLRIEFLSKDETAHENADEIASIVLALSSLHKAYAYPSILIEADFHARLNPAEIEMLTDKILDKLGSNYKLFLRRNIRPF